METKARSIYDYEAIKAMTHAITYKKRNPKKSFCFWNVYAIVMMAIVWLMIYFNIGDNLGWMIILIIVILALNCFMYWGLPRIQYKALVKLQGIENEFVFYEDEMKIISKNDEYQGEAEIKYSMIPKVMETSRYFFVFQSKNQVYIIDKTKIFAGYSEDISYKLKTVVKKNYIVCRY